jgi:hypothetical protein
MKPRLFLLPLLLSSVAFAQAPPPSAPSPAPHPSPPQPQALQPPSSEPPAPPAIALVPKDPTRTRTLLHMLEEEKKAQEQTDGIIKQLNQQIQQSPLYSQLVDLQATQRSYEKLAADEITDIKKEENWGPEVKFNPKTEKFEKPLPRPEDATKKEKK